MAASSQPSPSRATSAGTSAGHTETPSVVETPTSPSSALALARFEFEAGKANEGTKILMVEWDASAAKPEGGNQASGTAEEDWEVSWEGKTTVLPARDSAEPAGDDGGGRNRRVFFLLPPGAPVPPLVTISRGSKGPGRLDLYANPLPAIFHPALGLGTRDVGTRGVLHTIWAKKRLSELQAEIDREMKTNGESVGLEMALQEKQWIVDHFGLPGPTANPKADPAPAVSAPGPAGQTSPRSPAGKLGEKLKGLKLATSPIELAAASQASRLPQVSSLSPQVADVAVSSFNTFHGSGGGGVASLDAVVRRGEPGAGIPAKPVAPPPGDSVDTEEDLFALPMSPRSPEMKRSPFSLLS